MKQLQYILEQFYQKIVGLMVLFMMFLVIFQVFARYLFGISPLFIEEAVTYVIVTVGTLGAVYGLYRNKHASLSFLREKLPVSLRRFHTLLINSIVIITILCVQGIGGFIFTQRTLHLTSTGVGYPLFFLHGLVFVAGSMGVVLMIIKTINDWKINEE